MAETRSSRVKVPEVIAEPRRNEWCEPAREAGFRQYQGAQQHQTFMRDVVFTQVNTRAGQSTEQQQVAELYAAK